MAPRTRPQTRCSHFARVDGERLRAEHATALATRIAEAGPGSNGDLNWKADSFEALLDRPVRTDIPEKTYKTEIQLSCQGGGTFHAQLEGIADSLDTFAVGDHDISGLYPRKAFIDGVINPLEHDAIPVFQKIFEELTVKRAIFLLVLLAACHKQTAHPEARPSWSASMPFPSPYPIRTAACGVTGHHVLIDVGSGLVSLDAADHTFSVAAPPAPPLEHTDAALALQGSNVLDVDTGATAAAPMLSTMNSDSWSEARGAKTFAYAQRLMPTIDGETFRLDVFGAHAWSTQVTGIVEAARLSNDGRVLAAIVRQDGAPIAQLKLFDEHGAAIGKPIDLGDTGTRVLLFDETGTRLAVMRKNGSVQSLAILGLDGHEITSVELGERVPGITGAIEKNNVFGGFVGDDVWMFSSGFVGNGEGHHSALACTYVHASIASKKAVGTRDLPDVFGADPGRTCTARVMCGMDDGGVVVLRHDMQTLTAEHWSSPP